MNTIAKLNGLVLAAGKSRRMGTDKGLIKYHRQAQRMHIYQLLNYFCDKVYMSIREDQQREFDSSVQCIIDKNHYPGPFNGIMSAHLKYPKAAWLVLACDMPLVDKNSIEKLIGKREVLQYATAYQASDKEFPEPLFAIWEPIGLQAAQGYLKDGHPPSPLQFLRSNKVETVEPLDDDVLLNANFNADYHSMIKKINDKPDL